ncbi:hypothetical protein COL940_014153, partial [Colletotrichum noveboracense]
LGIPYAQPPLGALRFLPPQPFPPSTSIINATTMPPACPQIKDTTYPVFQYVPETLPLGSFSEDCLTLNIYTPSNATASSNLPVIIWIYDGAFVQGSFDTPEWNLAPWVQTSQAHIVVAVQYRLNIFGFPGAAPALEHQNLDILDQRRAVEWARAALTCTTSRSRRTSWGRDLFATRGLAFLTVDTRSTNSASGNFSAVARGLGRATEVPGDELDRMRRKPFDEIVGRC